MMKMSLLSIKKLRILIKKFEELKKKKEKRLQKVYNNIIKNNFKSESREIMNYISKFTDKEIPKVNYKIGSNLHGFMGDFKKKVNSTNFAYLSAGSSVDTINFVFV